MLIVLDKCYMNKRPTTMFFKKKKIIFKKKSSITVHAAYLGAGHKLRGSQGALGCRTDHFVLLSGVGGCAGHSLRLQDQGGCCIGHSLGQRQ